jgi:hypothetical protein
MGLGPSYCKKCMLLLEGGFPEPGPYWKCVQCGVDPDRKDTAYLFQCTAAELDIILKDHPKLRKTMDDIRESHRKK